MAGGGLVISGRVDGEGRLVAADIPLAALQRACGGTIPGTLAVPALLELVREAARQQRALSRPIRAQDATHAITAVADIAPDPAGCTLACREWRSEPLPEPGGTTVEPGAALTALLAELHASLDADGSVLAVGHALASLEPLAAAMRLQPGRAWTDFVEVVAAPESSPGGEAAVETDVRVGEGGERWRARVVPRSAGRGEEGGADLYLLPWDVGAPPPSARAAGGQPVAAIGRDLAQGLQLRIERIIAVAEAIRAPDDSHANVYAAYVAYAGDIADAARHLRRLLGDLAELESIEAPGLDFAAEPVDLADAARRAAAMLGAPAQQRRMRVEPPPAGSSTLAFGEPGRVLQVALNLLGNALRYAPEGSTVRLITAVEGSRGRLTVVDQGPGLSPGQQARVFAKFERLGRSAGEGSGLGLYIARRLARAMGGDLTVASALGEGARFTLELPAAR
ncbi:MAG: ATP-binding protein [Novosphingobium sp.]